ncbi:hypothetical protein GCM10009800_29600 [Nocardiopsis rhodophaea]
MRQGACPVRAAVMWASATPAAPPPKDWGRLRTAGVVVEYRTWSGSASAEKIVWAHA